MTRISYTLFIKNPFDKSLIKCIFFWNGPWKLHFVLPREKLSLFLDDDDKNTFKWSVIKLALCKEWTKDFWWCLLRLWNPITKKKLDCFYDKQISLSWLKTLAKNTKSKQVFFWSKINNFAKLLFLFCNLVVLNRLFALGIKSFLEMTFNVP